MLTINLLTPYTLPFPPFLTFVRCQNKICVICEDASKITLIQQETVIKRKYTLLIIFVVLKYIEKIIMGMVLCWISCWKKYSIMDHQMSQNLLQKKGLILKHFMNYWSTRYPWRGGQEVFRYFVYTNPYGSNVILRYKKSVTRMIVFKCWGLELASFPDEWLPEGSGRVGDPAELAIASAWSWSAGGRLHGYTSTLAS